MLVPENETMFYDTCHTLLCMTLSQTSLDSWLRQYNGRNGGEILQNRLLWWLIFDRLNWLEFFNLIIFLKKYWTAGHLVFLTRWPAVNLKKFVSQNMVSYSEPSISQALDFTSINHFRIAWHFLINIQWFELARTLRFHKIYKKYQTSGHLLFFKPWPVTAHIATAHLF